MSDIKRLPEEISCRIAAGEVVERPSSVVKELMENSLDAGSSRILVSLRQGGKSSLVVEDDGCGIPFEEMELAVERYATSKLISLDDLEMISSLGFRGEALASIGAVSRLELRSREKIDEEGGVIRVQEGQASAKNRIHSPGGTRVQVDDLFCNLPARRKFLKSASAEYRRVLVLIQSYALAYPDVAFFLENEGRQTFSSNGDGDRRALVEKMWGLEPPLRRHDLVMDGTGVSLVWQPTPGSRRTRLESFVNGRRIQDGMIRAALNATGADISGQWLVLLDIPPGEVDVNIHPAKAEVRFRYGSRVFDALRRSASGLLDVPRSLPLSKSAPSEYSPASFPSSKIPGLTPSQPRLRHVSSPGSGVTWTVSAGSARSQQRSEGNPSPFFSRVASPETSAKGETIPEGISEEVFGANESLPWFIGQMTSGFLLFESEGALVIMDPHAAHERVHYETISNRAAGRVQIQNLALPVPLPPSLAQRSQSLLERLQALGFRFEEKGGEVFVLGVPDLFQSRTPSPPDLVRTALDAMEEEQDGSDVDLGVWRRWATLACKRSVKLGERIVEAEALALWRNLGRCQNPHSCPHGRPVVLAIEPGQLVRHFGRE